MSISAKRKEWSDLKKRHSKVLKGVKFNKNLGPTIDKALKKYKSLESEAKSLTLEIAQVIIMLSKIKEIPNLYKKELQKKVSSGTGLSEADTGVYQEMIKFLEGFQIELKKSITDINIIAGWAKTIMRDMGAFK